MTSDEILARLSHYDALPVEAMEAASAKRAVMAPLFIDRIERYLALAEDDRDDDLALFPIVHLLAEWQETRAYRSLARLFRLGDDELEMLLGDAVTEFSHRVVAAVCDGDPRPIYDIILDEQASQWTRDRMFDALVLLAVSGVLERQAVVAFVESAYESLLPRVENMVWGGWLGAVARLGLSALAPKVKQAIDESWVPAGLMNYEDFEADLRFATAHLDAPFKDTRDSAPFGRAVDELAVFSFDPHDEAVNRFDVGDPDEGFLERLISDFYAPAVNPFRSVGRNDPCPCGSGKKFKKCCLLNESH